MRLQIDFSRKTIKLEDDVNLKEFFDKIKEFIPDYEKYTLENNSKIEGTVYNYNTPYWYNNPIQVSNIFYMESEKYKIESPKINYNNSYSSLDDFLIENKIVNIEL